MLLTLTVLSTPAVLSANAAVAVLLRLSFFIAVVTRYRTASPSQQSWRRRSGLCRWPIPSGWLCSPSLSCSPWCAQRVVSRIRPTQGDAAHTHGLVPRLQSCPQMQQSQSCSDVILHRRRHPAIGQRHRRNSGGVVGRVYAAGRYRQVALFTSLSCSPWCCSACS